VKCGNYWEAGTFGPFKVELSSQSGGEDSIPANSNSSGFDFGGSTKAAEIPDAMNGMQETVNIKRHFVVSRTDRPDDAPRKITQLQCTAWPDFDVPENPEILWSLIKDVDEASADVGCEKGTDRADHAPVLVHCEQHRVS
jgi:protein tyrosine phosphatase